MDAGAPSRRVGAPPSFWPWGCRSLGRAGAEARRAPPSRAAGAWCRMVAGWLRRHARFMQDEHGSEATGRVGRNRPTERDCLTSSTRYSAFSVQVQSMGVCGCVECAGPGAVGVWCVDVCVHWVCVQCVCRVDKSRQLQGEINAGPGLRPIRPFSLQSTTLVSRPGPWYYE